MGKSSGAAPSAPDPAKVIPLQTQANLDTFNTMLGAQRANTYGPTGSQTWEKTPVFNQSGYDQALAAYNQQQGQASQAPATPDYSGSGDYGEAGIPWTPPPVQTTGSAQTGNAPTREQFTTDQWAFRTTLSPEQQQLYDQNVQSQLQQGNLLQGMGNQVAQATQNPLDFSGAPQLTSGLAAPELQGYSGPQAPNLQNPTQNALQPGQLSQGVNDALQGYNSQIGQLDPTQFNQQAADALYGQSTRYLDPQASQQKRELEGRLAEQGFVPGTPAYNQAMQNFSDTNNRAYADARDRSVTAGVASGQANFGNSLQALQSQIATALQGGNFQNNQQAQDFSQQQAGANQQRQVGLDANATGQQNFINAQDAAQRAFENNNKVSQQDFQNQQTSGLFGNQARQQAIAEILQKRNQPLNELSALRSGTQVQMPQGNGTYGTPNLPGTDVQGAYQNQYLGNLGAYNAQTAGNNADLNSLLQGLGMAGMFAFGGSDIRLKTDIRPFGRTRTGLNLYSYKILGKPEIGVLAQEVLRTRPDLVRQFNDILAVNYAGVF